MPKPLRRLRAAAYDVAMLPAEHGRVGEWRHGLLALAEGDVVEVGAGTGLMLPHYRGVREVVAVEPDPAMRARLARRAGAARVPVRVAGGVAERLPLADRSADTVVFGFVLCGVERPHEALAEARRVLRPGGCLLFLEHVRAGRDRWAARQDRLDPAWRRAAGCHVNRDILGVLREAGLEPEVLRRMERPYGVPLVPVALGRARA